MVMEARKLYPLTLAFLLVLTMFLIVESLAWIYRGSFQQIDDIQQHGFEPVECWFGDTTSLPRTECYYMHVPQNHVALSDTVIKFPVVVFRSDAMFSTKAPVLHLGAGGPGAPMYFDSLEGVRTIYEYHDALSTEQGRDLFVIDPRGTGLSKPLLTCDVFVENEEKRLNYNLSFEAHSAQVSNDYFECIEKYKSQGVDFSTYNSLSIASDIEMMRIAAGVDQWVLFGVSYGASYAQTIVTQYPESVESMVLDSAAFPNLKSHDNYLNRSMASYLALYDYCGFVSECTTAAYSIESRIWRLHKRLNTSPIELELSHPYENRNIDVLLNGERFIGALLYGVYGESIFADLPKIIIELENSRSADTITWYLENYIGYLLDADYGDVSSSSHYCYEDKPYTNFELMRTEAAKLPKGYIRDTALLSIDLPDYCNEMSITDSDPIVSQATETDIPSLFIHGEFDTVTPLSDVVEQQKLFTKSHVITFKLSHDVIGGDECAEIIAAKFVRNTDISRVQLDCS